MCSLDFEVSQGVKILITISQKPSVRGKQKSWFLKMSLHELSKIIKIIFKCTTCQKLEGLKYEYFFATHESFLLKKFFKFGVRVISGPLPNCFISGLRKF